MIRYVLIATLCVSSCLAALPTIASDVPLTVKAPEALMIALRNGDRQAVQKLVSQQKIGTITATLSRAQLNYHLDEILEVAEKCQGKLVSQEWSGHFVGAFYCNELARAAALSLGNAHAFLSAANFAAREIMPGASAAHGKTFSFGNGLDHVDLGELADATPPLTLAWISEAQELAIAKAETGTETRSGSGIDIAIDGVRVVAMVRPSSGLVAPVTIVVQSGARGSVYAKFRLEVLVKALQHVLVNGDTATSTSVTDLALAQTIRIGPLAMHHVGVVVLQSPTLPPGVYLGMSLFARFGGVAVGEGHVALGRKPLSGCASMVPMTFAGTVTLHGSLQFPAALNQTRVRATWRPMLRTPLGVDPTTLSTVTHGAANGFTRTLPSARSHMPLALTVGTTVLRPGSAYAPKVWNKPNQVEIGGALLADHIVFLQFGKGAPMIGFCARNPSFAGG